MQTHSCKVLYSFVWGHLEAAVVMCVCVTDVYMCVHVCICVCVLVNASVLPHSTLCVLF